MNSVTHSVTPYLLLAEDDRDLRLLLAASLRQAGHRVVECAHGVELVEYLDRVLDGDTDTGLCAVVTDVRMPGITGMSVLEGLHDLGAQVPVFLITAFGSDDLHERAAQFGAVRTFDKPFDIEDLVSEVARVVSGESRE